MKSRWNGEFEMAARLSTAFLYWRTLRHLKAAQLYWLARDRMGARRRTMCHAPEPLPAIHAGARDGLRGFAIYWAANAPPDRDQTEAFLNNRFTFLSKTIQSSHPRWSGLDVSKLWHYNLHYFDFARDVALLHPEPNGPAAAHVRAWVSDWIEKNQDRTIFAWDPYPLSMRLINWSLVFAIYGWDDYKFRESMHLQLDYLRRHMERSLQGNHLLKNAVALTVAGAFLGSDYYKMGIALLRKEVRSQILPDGGHAERSPMYHGQVLIDLLLSTAVMENNPDWLADATQRAIVYLHGVTHGDGCAAQFNDGAAEQAPIPRTVQALAKKFYFGLPLPHGSVAFPDTGHYRLAPGGDAGVFIVKAGKSTLDHQPGHAHSDLMSFEYSVGAQRVFVNSGTHGYAESPHRDYCRSIAAHNTVRPSGEYQLEHWSTFRVGRRVHGEVHQWNPEAPALTASYGGRHERSIDWNPGGWWRLVDVVTYQGKHAIQAYFHLHPDGQASAVEIDGLPDRMLAFRIEAGPSTLTMLFSGARDVVAVRGQDAPFQGWYFPRFGESVPATTLVCRAFRSTYRSRLYTAIVVNDASVQRAAVDLAERQRQDDERK